ncbi:MAG: glycosyltransferase family 2 protein [Candidatus Uhrbacteria bacterium]|nr:glycosyltransferase family 2 protein [Candidatus Uhrbacteria bacterium]
MRVFAVIPAWNEAPRLGGVLEAIRPYVDGVVVVDDGSVDDTSSVARAGGAITLRHMMNRGQGAALRTGTEAALRLGADIIVHVDADGQHDPSMIKTLVDPIREGEADVVFGSRFLGIDPTGMPKIRRMYFWAAKLFNTYVVGISRRVTDPQSGARAMSAAAAKVIDFRQDFSAHCSEILRLVTKSNLRWKEVPVHVRYTQETLQKGQKFTEAFRILWHLLIRGTK